MQILNSITEYINIKLELRIILSEKFAILNSITEYINIKLELRIILSEKFAISPAKSISNARYVVSHLSQLGV